MALAPLNPETRNLIDGRLVHASNGATFENVNPATEEVLGVCADGPRGRPGRSGPRRRACPAGDPLEDGGSARSRPCGASADRSR